MQDFKNYENEARNRFGDTDAYKEYTEKAKDFDCDRFNALAKEMNGIFAELFECMAQGHSADSEKAQALVRKLQAFICENYYTCTNEILACLGETYVTDPRFKSNIDKNGTGTAEFVSAAIKHYCGE